VDLGTAITFDAVSANAEYPGGTIAAGVGISADALLSRGARLPLVDFRKPVSVIGTNTVVSLHSGYCFSAMHFIRERMRVQ
jgi:type III pantothenate kinase